MVATLHVEMAPMQINRDDGSLGVIDAEIYADVSFDHRARQSAIHFVGAELKGMYVL